MTSIEEPTVAGVSAIALFAILRKMKMAPEKDGLVQMSLRVDRDENAILVRALERIEAELRADDKLGLSPGHSRRTARQRRYDCLKGNFQRRDCAEHLQPATRSSFMQCLFDANIFREREMPKSLRQRLDHDEALAEIFMNYEPRDEDLVDAAAWRALLRAVEARADAEREIISAVAAMRAGKWPWSDIGHLLGTSGQAAQQRYGSRQPG